MGKPLQHTLKNGDAERGIGVITYGKCVKSPYVENGLWFVHIPRTGINGTSTTFLVDPEFARPSVMDDFDIDFDKWNKIARLAVPGGDWNPEEECLWRNMPYYVHTLPDGTPIRFGLSRSQSKDHPDRELWYIVLGLGHEDKVDLSKYEAFVVDKVCTEPAFLDKMGNDPARWIRICWSHPASNEPWFAQIEQVPDPYAVIREDEAKAKRPWWQKLLNV